MVTGVVVKAKVMAVLEKLSSSGIGEICNSFLRDCVDNKVENNDKN